MVCIAWSVIISLILAVVWPVVQSGINAGKQVFGQDPLWLAWVTDLINYKDAGNMEAYKTLLTTVTPARFKVGQMIGATGLLLGVALAMYRRVDADKKDNGIQSMSRSGKVDGFIVLYSRKDDPIIDHLFSEGLLYILIGKATQYTNQTLYIDNDNLLAGEDATEYLYQLGHRKIAYLGSDSSLTFAADRKTGYQIALTKHGIPFRPEYCAEVLNVSGDNTEAISSLLLQDEPPTAIVVSDDILAVSLERVCLQNHVSIPDDLSIISFNNSLFARSTSPQLTSIDINSKQLGIEAASQMINHIENPNLVATKIIVPHQLIERDSCCKING